MARFDIPAGAQGLLAMLDGAAGVLAQAGEAGSAQGVGLVHYLLVSALIFGIGLMVIITRRNAIAVLMGIELLLNAAGLNFIAFAKFASPDRINGQVITLFLIVIAAAEAALALALTLNIYNRLNTVDVDEASSLRG